ncbi:MAG: leucine-rich repeat protein [Clostridiales bacterium]|nr:leucine-rich repeat protein [Clostridiales bacterium]
MEITLENGLIMENGVVKSGKNCEGDIVLPEDAKAIAPKAFYNNKKITSLTLPEGLTSIGAYAVSGCKNLAYMLIPGSVTDIGDHGLMKKFESDVGFTHVMENKEYYPLIRCPAGSYVDTFMQQIRQSDSWEDSHGTRHFVEIEYI